MTLEDFKYIEEHYTQLKAISNSNAWGNVDLEFKHRLNVIGANNGWNYCNTCNSGFFRLVNLCLENYEKQRKITNKNKKVNKRKSESSISN